VDTERSGKFRLEGFGAQVSDGTGTTDAIVVDGNVLEDRPAHGFSRLEPVAVDDFDLERGKEAFGAGVVEAARLAAHAANQVVPRQQRLVLSGTVLTSAIGMDDDATRHPSPPQGHLVLSMQI